MASFISACRVADFWRRASRSSSLKALSSSSPKGFPSLPGKIIRPVWEMLRIKPSSVGPGVQFLEDGVALLGEFVHQGFPALGIVFAFKDLRDLHPEGGDQVLHLGLENPALARGQVQSLGLLRLLEIIDVDIIRGRRFGRGQLAT